MRAHDVDAISEVLARTSADCPELEGRRCDEPATLVVEVGRGQLWLSGCEAPLPQDPATLVDLCGCAAPAVLDQGAAYLSLPLPVFGGLSLVESADACLSAVLVAETVSMGSVALVRSHDGLERAGLVAGLALRLLGFGGLEAVRLVRGRHGALTSTTFLSAVTLPLEHPAMPGPSPLCALRVAVGRRRGPGRRVAGVRTVARA